MSDIDLFKPFSELKSEGNWPIPWTSGIGLIPVLRERYNNSDIFGLELGVNVGSNLVYFLEELPNIKNLIAIDPFIPYDDGPGGFVSEEIINKVKSCFIRNIQPFNDKVTFINKTSDSAVFDVEDESLDYIFIDGDHSFEAVKNDIFNYYSKVKKGGIFAGHDWSWGADRAVQRALQEFVTVNNLSIEIFLVPNDTWFFVK